MAEKKVTKRLTTIVSADVAGYSRLMEADETGTLEALKAHRAVTDPKIGEYGGRIVGTAGDGLLVEFPSVSDAVSCCLEVQSLMAERNADVPADKRMEFRMGINLGDVMIEGDDIFGTGVNVAARLQQLAEPGDVCISDVVFKSIRGKLDVGFADLGPQKVKNIAEPIPAYKVLLDPAQAGTVVPAKPRLGIPSRRHVGAFAAFLLLIIGAGVVWWQPWRPSFRPDIPLPNGPSIAILPFDNLSGDSKAETFAEGLSSDITASLAKLPRIFVIAEHTMREYKRKAVNVRQVSREIGVRHVLEGSVQKTGDQLRITAKLVNGITGGYVWSEVYDRHASKFFAIKDEITLNILKNLEVKLTGRDRALATQRDTNNLQAWLHNREATQAYLRTTKENNRRARELAKQAIRLDPTYAAPRVRLALTHMMDARLRWVDHPKKSMAKAEEIVRRTMEVAPNNADANRGLAALHLHKLEYAKALAAAKQAVFLAPNDALNVGVYGYVLQKANQAQRSVLQLERALRLDPFAPMWMVESLGESYVMAGRYRDAIPVYQRALQLQSRGAAAGDAHLGLALAYDAVGRNKQARQEIQKATEVMPQYTVAYLRKWQLYRDKTYQEQWLAKLERLGLPKK